MKLQVMYFITSDQFILRIISSSFQACKNNTNVKFNIANKRIDVTNISVLYV